MQRQDRAATMIVTETSTASAPQPTADPGPVFGLLSGVTSYWVLAAALGLGLFDALHAGVDDIAGHADRCDAEADRLEVLCGVLCDHGLVVREEGRWLPSAAADAFLTAGSARPLGGLVLHGPGRHENLAGLVDVVRGAAPARPVDDDGEFWADLFDATFPTQRALAIATARNHEVLDGQGEGLRIIEVGPAAGAWAVGLLGTRPDATAAVEALPAVLPRLVLAAHRHAVDDRLRSAALSTSSDPGDGHGDADADVVVLANSVRLHSRAGAAAAIASAARRLAAGGVLVDADYFTDALGRTGTTARLMAATMLANTRHGRAYTEAEHRAWIAAAGLTTQLRLEPMPGFPVLVARHPEDASSAEART